MAAGVALAATQQGLGCQYLYNIFFFWSFYLRCRLGGSYTEKSQEYIVQDTEDARHCTVSFYRKACELKSLYHIFIPAMS